jgi:hypothetical protein
MSAQHALLSPSGASRWLQCTPSARLEAKYSDKAGEAADEGTLAHKLSEIMLEHSLKRIDKATFLKAIGNIKKHKLYTPAMWEYCEQFKVFVLAQYAEALERASDAVIFLEQKVDLTHLIPSGFGTRDIAIVAHGVLDITDLKYGKGVEVSAEENAQLMIYALGTLDEFDSLFDIDIVRLNIFQPRIDNYSTWEISADKLRTWGDDVVAKQAKLAYEGKGKLVAGAHCKFCRAAAKCTALAQYNLEIARLAFAEPTELSDKELVEVFKKAPQFMSWINSISSFMLTQSLEQNKKWPGLKLVAGRSNRCISDEAQAIAKLKAKKIRPDSYLSKPTLLGITALDKNIGAAVLAKTLGRLIIKPEGKPTLVDVKDSRPEFHSAAAAGKAFGIKPKTITKNKKR